MDALTILPFVLLMAAVIGLWVHRHAWMAALAAAIGAGYHTGALQGLAALWVAVAVVLAWFYAWARARPSSAGNRALQIAAGLAFFIHALAMALPLLPGFIRVELVAPQMLSAGAEPYGISVGFPKVTVGILILGLINPVLSRAGLGGVLARALPIWLLTTALVTVFALAMGYTAFAPKLGAPILLLFALWAPINLFFTCMSEEAFFRGFIQHELAHSSRARAMRVAALVIAAMLFGLLHYKGGATYVIAGVIAGLGYGWAFMGTGRIEAAMAVHFGVNATHFLLFAYPRLA
jgi:uncharacterized protein